MTKNITIENYISYQKSTDKSPATLTSYRSDLIQFAIWFESINGVEMKLLNIRGPAPILVKSYQIARIITTDQVSVVENNFKTL